jgi:hypothetical protein
MMDFDENEYKRLLCEFMAVEFQTASSAFDKRKYKPVTSMMYGPLDFCSRLRWAGPCWIAISQL